MYGCMDVCVLANLLFLMHGGEGASALPERGEENGGREAFSSFYSKIGHIR